MAVTKEDLIARLDALEARVAALEGAASKKADKADKGKKADKKDPGAAE